MSDRLDETTANPGANATTRAGFCQECGQALTLATLRRMSNGIFCERCASLRQSTAGWQTVNHSAPYTGPRPPGSLPVSPNDEPNPVLAGFLGLIPGVGAMFNGQYAKAALHLIVFVILVALADNLNWVLWWLVWGWIFYQAFEAYHTAKARRDHLPLPNPFGWNDIGERMGFATRSASGAQAGFRGGFPPRRESAHWAGYTPWSEPAAPASVPTPEPSAHNPNANPYTAPYARPYAVPVPPSTPPVPAIPYSPTFTGQAPGQTLVSTPAGTPSLVAGTRRFPVGAIWLIGLGVLFLLGNLLPEWRVSGRWLVPLLLATLAAWSAVRRWKACHAAPRALGCAPNLAGAMVGPVFLFTVAVLLALQVGNVVRLHRSWPVLLVVWGMMLLIQRSAGALVPDLPATTLDPVAPPVRSTSGTGSLGL